VLYRQPPPGHVSGKRRQQAFVQAARQRGLVVTSEAPGDLAGLLSDREKARLAAPRSQRPTAIACWSDHAAHHALAHCAQAGLAVPGDVAVIGFNGIDVAGAPAPRLTTIRAPWMQVGQEAVRLVGSLIRGERVARLTTLPVELVEGDTT
jgi:DNA-binding LacI/PurR family transcriptional regulator